MRRRCLIMADIEARIEVSGAHTLTDAELADLCTVTQFELHLIRGAYSAKISYQNDGKCCAVIADKGCKP
jgi:hypothetical protein